MEHDEIKKNCISGCAAEKKAETCGGKQNSKRKKTDVIDIAQQLKNEKKYEHISRLWCLLYSHAL